jgi:hypothetical protein
VLLVAVGGVLGCGVGGWGAFGRVHGFVVGGFVCFLVVDLVRAYGGLVAEGPVTVLAGAFAGGLTVEVVGRGCGGVTVLLGDGGFGRGGCGAGLGVERRGCGSGGGAGG